MKWKNKNAGKHPADPDYIDGYDPDEDYERFLQAQEEMEQSKRENQ